MDGGERHSLSVDRPVVGTGRHDVDGNRQTEAQERLRFLRRLSLRCVLVSQPSGVWKNGHSWSRVRLNEPHAVRIKTERRERGISEMCQLPPGNIPEGDALDRPGRSLAQPWDPCGKGRKCTAARRLGSRKRFGILQV